MLKYLKEGDVFMENDSLVVRQAKAQTKRILTSALYEAKIKEDEIKRLLIKYCNIDDDEAIILIQNEKFINVPCKKLMDYLIFEIGYSYRDADIYVHNYAKSALAGNTEFSKLTASKLFEMIEKRK